MTKSKRQGILIRASRLAALQESQTDSELFRLAESKKVFDRIVALMTLRIRARECESIRPYLDVARRLIHDADNNCRWQALIVVGEGVEREPELVWDVISAEGGSSDEDMRAGVATILLEHLLDEHFTRYFPLVRERVLSGDKHFADTLSTCWLSDPAQKKRVESLVKNARRGQS